MRTEKIVRIEINRHIFSLAVFLLVPIRHIDQEMSTDIRINLTFKSCAHLNLSDIRDARLGKANTKFASLILIRTGRIHPMMNHCTPPVIDEGVRAMINVALPHCFVWHESSVADVLLGVSTIRFRFHSQLLALNDDCCTDLDTGQGTTGAD